MYLLASKAKSDYPAAVSKIDGKLKKLGELIDQRAGMATELGASAPKKPADYARVGMVADMCRIL